jgi:CBS domain containing-hemolysin-like protein
MMLATEFTATEGVLLAVVLLLIAASAVFSLAETSLVRTSRARAKALEDEGHVGARSLRRLVEHPDRFLSPILLLVLFSQLVAATLVGVISGRIFGPWGVAAATVFEVVVIFVFGEAVPKNWAVRNASKAALLAAPFVTAIIRFAPIRWITTGLVWLSNNLTPGRRNPAESGEVTESELLAMADVAHADEAIETEERQLIHSIIDFGDTVVREVMIPRPDIIAVPGSSEVGAALERAIDAGYSRLPVFAADLDDVIGIAYTKDLIRTTREGDEHTLVRDVSRDAHYVPETKRVAPLMREMQAQQFHIAVVIDEYGGTAGLVTLEDLIEELVGEIVDEYDVAEPLIESLADGSYRVGARMPLDSVNELLEARLPEGDWDTIGGLMLALLGHIPHEGESVAADGYLLVAERVQGRRIGRIRIERLAPVPSTRDRDVGTDDRADAPADRQAPDGPRGPDGTRGPDGPGGSGGTGGSGGAGGDLASHPQSA